MHGDGKLRHPERLRIDDVFVEVTMLVRVRRLNPV